MRIICEALRSSLGTAAALAALLFVHTAHAQDEETAAEAYLRSVINHVERNWVRPPSAPSALRCVVNVSQIPSGDIISFDIGACNGDDAVRRSIGAAVRLASPLPRPADPALYQRTIELVFTPEAE